jgi:hypothetical protein
LSREIPAIVRASGFSINGLEQMYLPSTPRFTGYNYWGEAHAA